MEMSSQYHTPAALTPVNNSKIWPGRFASIEIQTPGPTARILVAIPTLPLWLLQENLFETNFLSLQKMRL